MLKTSKAVATAAIAASTLALCSTSVFAAPVSLSFNTANFNATTGVVSFKNGQNSLKARAVTGFTVGQSGSTLPRLTINDPTGALGFRPPAIISQKIGRQSAVVAPDEFRNTHIPGLTLYSFVTASTSPTSSSAGDASHTGSDAPNTTVPTGSFTLNDHTYHHGQQLNSGSPITPSSIRIPGISSVSSPNPQGRPAGTSTDLIGVSGSPVSLTITGLETFNNSGLIDFVNGASSDHLFAAGTAFNASGLGQMNLGELFTGMDAHANTVRGGKGCSGSAAFADCMVVGNVRGTGTVIVTDTHPAPGTINLLGTVAVHGTSGTNTNFTLTGSNVITTPQGLAIPKGFVLYQLVFDQPHNDWDLIGVPSQLAAELIKKDGKE